MRVRLLIENDTAPGFHQNIGVTQKSCITLHCRLGYIKAALKLILRNYILPFGKLFHFFNPFGANHINRPLNYTKLSNISFDIISK